MSLIEPIRIEEYLDSLGTTPDEIAENLKGLDIKAVIGCSSNCAIAEALELKFGEPFSVDGWDTMQLDRFKTRVLDSSKRALLPSAVRDFIYNFDAGHYPYLVESND
jgi:hypothetical protein